MPPSQQEKTEKGPEIVVLGALVEAVEKYDAANRAYRSPTAPEGAGQDLWAAESSLGQALHEAKQFLAKEGD